MNRKEMTGKQADEGTRLLADPTRFQIYRTVVGAAEQGMTTAEVAERFGLHRNVARMHLEKLSKAGLLASGLRKPPGGGRPAREYHMGDAVTCQYPPRDYQLLADITLTALEENADPQKVARRIGREIGEQGLARRGIDMKMAGKDQLLASFKEVIEEQGMFARVEAEMDGMLTVQALNCIFKELSSKHASLVCVLHSQLFSGICESHFSKVKMRKGPMEIAQGGMSCQFTVKYTL